MQVVQVSRSTVSQICAGSLGPDGHCVSAGRLMHRERLPMGMAALCFPHTPSWCSAPRSPRRPSAHVSWCVRKPGEVDGVTLSGNSRSVVRGTLLTGEDLPSVGGEHGVRKPSWTADSLLLFPHVRTPWRGAVLLCCLLSLVSIRSDMENVQQAAPAEHLRVIFSANVACKCFQYNRRYVGHIHTGV